MSIKERVPVDMNLMNKIRLKATHLASSYGEVQFDKNTGLYKYILYGKPVYVKYRRDVVNFGEHLWKCNHIYYKNYTPQPNDTILDLGAGYGEEAVFLANKCSGINYVGFETLPSVYECLSNTLKELDGNYRASPFAIDEKTSLFMSSQYKYASTETQKKGVIEVFCKKWDQVAKLYDIQKVDLFKMNIEGAELDVLKCLTNLDVIKRFAIECHDFRADRKHGEHFNTKQKVIDFLTKNGYKCTESKFNIKGYEWADHWVYAEK